MIIKLSDQQIAVLKIKCNQFNIDNGGGKALSEADYASMIVSEAMGVYEVEVAQRINEIQVAEFRRLTNVKRAAALESAKANP